MNLLEDWSEGCVSTQGVQSSQFHPGLFQYLFQAVQNLSPDGTRKILEAVVVGLEGKSGLLSPPILADCCSLPRQMLSASVLSRCKQLWQRDFFLVWQRSDCVEAQDHDPSL